MGGDSVGARVRRLRRAGNMTVGELADRVGVSRPTIWAWECNKSHPRSCRIPALAASLNVSEEELLVERSAPRAVLSLVVDEANRLEEEIGRSKARIAGLAGTVPEKVEIAIRW